jgi:hypothetical protein
VIGLVGCGGSLQEPVHQDLLESPLLLREGPDPDEQSSWSPYLQAMDRSGEKEDDQLFLSRVELFLAA